ncbi:MAG: 3'-5' exoribonuclease YhaM family protein [Solirubrobacteraceae bacterium]
MRVSELEEGAGVCTELVVRAVRTLDRRDGGERLLLTLGDRTGSVPAIVLRADEQTRAACGLGEVVRVTGALELHPRYGRRLVVETIAALRHGEYDPGALSDGPARPAGQLEADLRELVATVQDRDLRRLLAALLGEGSPTWARFRDAPAAKRYHQAYRHGLLEHSLTVAQAVSAISATFPGIDRDIAVSGALLHDIGKLDAYELRGEAIEMTDEGRLYGEIALGYHCVRSAIDALDGFPAATAQALLHIILSHHGSLEHGSPVVPCTREATIVHMIDNLGGRLGSFDRVEKGMPVGERWSPYDKVLGAGAYFAAGAGMAPGADAMPEAGVAPARTRAA